MRYKQKIFKIPIFGGKVIVAQGGDIHKVSKKFKVTWNEEESKESLDGVYGFVFNYLDESKRRYLVWFKEEPSVNTIVHECVHIVNRLFMDIGLELDERNDEAQAYVTGYISELIFNNVKYKLKDAEKQTKSSKKIEGLDKKGQKKSGTEGKEDNRNEGIPQNNGGGAEEDIRTTSSPSTTRVIRR